MAIALVVIFVSVIRAWIDVARRFDSLPQGDLQGDVVSVFIAILMTFAFWRIAIEHVEIITKFQ
jgi:hypothetical protein